MVTRVGRTLDYDALEETGKKRANKLFGLYFKAARRHPTRAGEIRLDYARGGISYEGVLRKPEGA